MSDSARERSSEVTGYLEILAQLDTKFNVMFFPLVYVSDLATKLQGQVWTSSSDTGCHPFSRPG